MCVCMYMFRYTYQHMQRWKLTAEMLPRRTRSRTGLYGALGSCASRREVAPILFYFLSTPPFTYSDGWRVLFLEKSQAWEWGHSWLFWLVFIFLVGYFFPPFCLVGWFSVFLSLVLSASPLVFLGWWSCHLKSIYYIIRSNFYFEVA